MKESEKRAGLSLEQATALKPKLDSIYTRDSSVRRSVLVKVDNDDFSPSPESLVDMKIKLIDNNSLLSVKHGSWHGDTAREEYEVNFNRDNLADLLSSFKLLGHFRYIMLSTVRTIWTASGLVITLDEYGKLGKALFEVELEHGDDSEQLIDDVFASLGVAPMNSAQTVDFIASLNRSKAIQLDLNVTEPSTAARAIVEAH